MPAYIDSRAFAAIDYLFTINFTSDFYALAKQFKCYYNTITYYKKRLLIKIAIKYDSKKKLGFKSYITKKIKLFVAKLLLYNADLY
ncbi:hypothetical protein B0O99DRAFT_628957 [Bisporella sp. PMI_857]|nr:hypothetical protein B0O99DRAFT_628957 [Bisporella sp. PMI_857]